MAPSRNPLDGLRETVGRLTDRVNSPGGDRVDELVGGILGPRMGPARPLSEIQAELGALVGLDSVKEQVRALVAFLQVQASRKAHGLPEVATSQHLVSLGNPGTGKTTVARLIAPDRRRPRPGGRGLGRGPAAHRRPHPLVALVTLRSLSFSKGPPD